MSMTLQEARSHNARAAELTLLARQIETVEFELGQCVQNAGSVWAMKLADMLETARRQVQKAHREALRARRYHTRKAKSYAEGR